MEEVFIILFVRTVLIVGMIGYESAKKGPRGEIEDFLPAIGTTSRAIKFLHPPRREFDFLFGTLRFQISVWPIEHCRIH